jgi:hypothetical protein
LSSASSLFFGGALSLQATALIGESSGASETSLASAGALASAPSAIAPPSSIISSASVNSHDEIATSAPPSPVGQEVQAAVVALAAGLANGEFQALSPRMRTIVQPIVRGLDSIGGRLWTIFKSIITNLARPRVAGKRAGVNAVFLDRASAGELGIEAVISSARGGPVDRFLETHRHDTLPVHIHGSEEDRTNGIAGIQREFVVFALMMTALGEFRVSKSYSGRIVCQRGSTWRKFRGWRRPLGR